jgi:putative spermidine/putrescine transport system permease protein
MFRPLRASFGTLVVLFLVAPLLAILPLAFTSSVFLTYPIPSYSVRWFEELAISEIWRRSIANSLIIGSSTALLATVIGTLAALGLRRNPPLSNIVRAFFMVPIVAPAVVLGVGMQILFVRLGLANTYVGVVVAHTVLALPFVIVGVTASLQGIDASIEYAAASLGASPLLVFWRMTVPLALPGIISGAVFAFATSFDEVVLTLFVAGPNQRTLARQMFSTIRENISPSIAAAAFVIVVGTLAIAMLVGAFRKATSA